MHYIQNSLKTLSPKQKFYLQVLKKYLIISLQLIVQNVVKLMNVAIASGTLNVVGVG
jgi:hypothetical protein